MIAIKFWTIRPIKDYDKLMENKILTFTKDEIDPFYYKNYRIAYDYMKNKLYEYDKNNLGNNNLMPIWVWEKYNGIYDKVDMTLEDLGPSGENAVQLTLNIDPNRVLLSDFIYWHYPLWLTYLCKSEEDENKIQDKYNLNYDNIDEYKLKKCVESWDIIFDINYCRNNRYFYENEDIKQTTQGVLWYIKLEDVIDIDFFTFK